MEVDNHLSEVENGLPRGHAIHFHVSSRECTVDLFRLGVLTHP